MTCCKPLVKQGAQVPCPQEILNNYPDLKLFTNFLFVNRLPFLITISSKVQFLTVQTGSDRTKKSILKGIDKVLNIYKSRGFNITDIHADNEFDMDNLRDSIRPALLHIYGVEERCRAMCHSIPYKQFTKLMMNSLVEYIIHWVNAFPSQNNASTTNSPTTIVTGNGKPNFAHKHIAFGSYAIAYAGTENNMRSRGVLAIALKLSNNRGGSYFMSLLSGEQIHVYIWHEVPIPNKVIDRVHKLADEDGQKDFIDGMPLFEWGAGFKIADKETDDINGMDIVLIDDNGREVNNITSTIERNTTIMSNSNELLMNNQQVYDEENESGVLDNEQENMNIEENIDDIFKRAETQLNEEIEELRNNEYNENRNLNVNGINKLADEDDLNETAIATEINEEISAVESVEPEILEGRSVRNRQPPNRLILDMGGKDYLSLRLKQLVQAKKEIEIVEEREYHY